MCVMSTGSGATVFTQNNANLKPPQCCLVGYIFKWNWANEKRHAYCETMAVLGKHWLLRRFVFQSHSLFHVSAAFAENVASNLCLGCLWFHCLELFLKTPYQNSAVLSSSAVESESFFFLAFTLTYYNFTNLLDIKLLHPMYFYLYPHIYLTKGLKF